jgi:hypothetical protein
MRKWSKKCNWCGEPLWDGNRLYFQCGTRVAGYIKGCFFHRWITQRDTKTDRCRDRELERKIANVLKRLISEDKHYK